MQAFKKIFVELHNIRSLGDIGVWRMVGSRDRAPVGDQKAEALAFLVLKLSTTTAVSRSSQFHLELHSLCTIAH